MFLKFVSEKENLDNIYQNLENELKKKKEENIEIFQKKKTFQKMLEVIKSDFFYQKDRLKDTQNCIKNLLLDIHQEKMFLTEILKTEADLQRQILEERKMFTDLIFDQTEQKKIISFQIDILQQDIEEMNKSNYE